jgi:hypothetical protein
MSSPTRLASTTATARMRSSHFTRRRDPSSRTSRRLLTRAAVRRPTHSPHHQRRHPRRPLCHRRPPRRRLRRWRRLPRRWRRRRRTSGPCCAPHAPRCRPPTSRSRACRSTSASTIAMATSTVMGTCTRKMTANSENAFKDARNMHRACMRLRVHMCERLRCFSAAGNAQTKIYIFIHATPCHARARANQCRKLIVPGV